MNINKNNLKKVADHQSDLIGRLKQENEKLFFSQNHYYQNVITSNDYYIDLKIDPVKILDVYNVPRKGYLGFSKKEFIDNVFQFESDVMFPQKDIKLILEQHYKRMALAESMDIEHFDIALKIDLISKNGSLIAADYISFYNMINRKCQTFVKFLPKNRLPKALS